MNTPDLLDPTDIAELLGLTRAYVVAELTKRPDFPSPTIDLSRKVRRWARADVLAWMQPDHLQAAPSVKPIMTGRQGAAAMLGIGTRLFDRLVKAGTLPAPRYLGSRPLWLIKELTAAAKSLTPATEQPTRCAQRRQDRQNTALLGLAAALRPAAGAAVAAQRHQGSAA